MAFTKEEKRDLRAKRKREREADEALRGVKRQPRGRPRFGCTWDDIAGKWIDNSVYAALVQGGVIDTSWERIKRYLINDDGTFPFNVQLLVRRFANRADAESWLQFRLQSDAQQAATEVSSPPPPPPATSVVFGKSRLQRAAERLARRRAAAAFDRATPFGFGKSRLERAAERLARRRAAAAFDRRSPFDRRVSV